MKIFQIRRSLWVPQAVEKVFDFFADARNLERLTPKWLHFRNLGNGHGEFQVGTRLEHRLKVKGIPVRWVSEIVEWDPPYGFVDEQKRGPYRYWRHEHLFEEDRGGTVCRDVVKYAVPGGAWVNRFFVAPDLKRIFDFRHEAMKKLLLQESP